MLEGKQCDIKKCSLMQKNPAKTLYSNKSGKVRQICGYYMIEFGKKELHLDTKITIFFNLDVFVVQRHKLYRCKLNLL